MRRRWSPNADDRPSGCTVDTLILHYTGMPTAAAALARLCEPAAKVSAHYTIDEDGTTYRHVPEEKRAWHAGVSYWAGARDINDRSVGIELVNPGHDFGYRPYPQAQIAALIELGRYPEAFRTYDRMAALKPSLASYARVSHARELIGDVPGAIDAMRLAAEAGGEQGEPVAWARLQLGKLEFGRGRLGAAEREYRAALAAFPGYAQALEAFDRRLPELIAKLRPDDLLLLTADHGNDPSWVGTDHTREQTPILMCHGTQDAMVSHWRGKQSAEVLRAAGYRVEWHEYPMQHEVVLEEIAVVGKFLTAVIGV